MPDHRQRLAFAYRRRAEDVKHFAGECRAQLIDPLAEEVGHIAHQRALRDGVALFDQRIEDSCLVASQHSAAINSMARQLGFEMERYGTRRVTLPTNVCGS